jgi:cystathionine gamma-synthase
VDHPTSNIKGEDICVDRATYVEERYGRNLPKGAAALAKQALQCRVAGVLVEENIHESPSQPPASQQGLADCNGTGDIQISPDDVYIYPCGMAAIWCAHDILLNIHSPAKSVCFGFVLSLSCQ